MYFFFVQEIFDIDCFLENLLGKDSSEDVSSETPANLNKIWLNLSKSIQEMHEKLSKIPQIIKCK